MSSTFLMRMARTASRSEVLEVEEEEQRFLVVEPAPVVVVGQWTTKAEYSRSPVEKGEEEEWKRRLKGLADSLHTFKASIVTKMYYLRLFAINPF
ncbi:hypothetical protein SLE2022_008230 [Rubroshorea leprosula]